MKEVNPFPEAFSAQPPSRTRPGLSTWNDRLWSCYFLRSDPWPSLEAERYVAVEPRVHVHRLGLHERGAGKSYLIKTAFLSTIPPEMCHY